MRQRILLHIGFWVAFVLYNGYLSVPLSGTSFAELSMTDRFLLGYQAEALLLFIKVPAVYFVLYKLLPQAINSQKVGVFILQVLAVAAALTFLSQQIWYSFIYPEMYHIDPPGQAATPWIGVFRWIFNSVDILLLLGIASAIKLFRIRLQTEKREKELIEEKLQSELKFLRSQTNPHFLFNTLNNLYHLSRKNSKSTPDAILKLSGLLRFMLYECTAPRIDISKEINIIEDYIELEKLRYGDRLKIDFKYEVDKNSQPIAPLMLLPFVENAFKHGASETRGFPEIIIDLKCKNGLLDFSVRNSKDLHLDQIKEGIGLKNIKRQLNLIYPQHDLKITTNEHEFIVELKAHLNENTAT